MQLVSVKSDCDENNPKPVQCDATDGAAKCSEFNFCGQLKEEKLSCPSAQPYCSKGKSSDFCSAQIDGSNEACKTVPGNDFKCTSVGYFPDPFSCSKFHLCYSGGLLSQECDDPNKQYYNSKSKTCLTLTAPTTQCITLRCSSANAGFYVYQPDDQLYYTCLEKTLAGPPETKSYVLDMFRCAQGETYVAGKSCWYRCPGVSRYPHENKQKYYKCLVLNGDYTVETCPGTSTFNPVTKQCDLQLVL